MSTTFVRIKGIIKKDDSYLIVKRWVDDRIPDPFVWEFIDAEVLFGQSPDEAVLSAVRDVLGIDGNIIGINYTWSNLIGDAHCVGIAYDCTIDESDEENIVLGEDYGEWKWIEAEDIDYYIENQYVLEDLRNAGIIK